MLVNVFWAEGASDVDGHFHVPSLALAVLLALSTSLRKACLHRRHPVTCHQTYAVATGKALWYNVQVVS